MNQTILLFCVGILLVGCSSVRTIGNVGPQKLSVHSITDNDFLSASRMILVLDKNGHVVAFTGGTVSGPGTIGVQAATGIVSATAIVVGAKAIQSGLQNSHVSTDNTIHIPNIKS